MHLLAALIFAFITTLSVEAKLPESITTILKEELGEYSQRMDLVLEQGDKKWLLIKPEKKLHLNDDPETITLITKTAKQDILLSNGWIYTPIEKNTIKSFDFFPEIFQDLLLQSKIHQEFIVPKGFKLPRDLAFLSGRLPIELGDIELASDRAELYKSKIQELKLTKPFEFLGYSFATGNLKKIALDKKTNEKVELDQDLDAGEIGLKYLSSIRVYDDEIYFSDLVSGKIHKYSKSYKKYDARKATEEIPLDAVELNVQEVFKLEDIGLDDGVKDFVLNVNKSILYLLTNKTSNLLIINMKEKSLIKRLEMPKMLDGFELLSRSSQEPDKLVFYSKARKEIFFVNGFDFRVSDKIDLKEHSKDFNFIPHSMLVAHDKIYLGVEVESKHTAHPADAGIMVFDSVTGSYDKFIELNASPRKIIRSKDEKSLYVLSQDQTMSELVKVDVKDFRLTARLGLDADIAQSGSVSELVEAGMLVIPSGTSKNILLVDAENFVALKKIALTESINIIKTLD